MRYPPTIFIDLDGTICEHQSPPWDKMMQPLPGVHQRFRDWWQKGYYIVVCTGRPDCLRQKTISELARLNILYNQLLTGLTSGPRYLINDKKPYDREIKMAVSIELERNEGLQEFTL